MVFSDSHLESRRVACPHHPRASGLFMPRLTVDTQFNRHKLMYKTAVTASHIHKVDSAFLSLERSLPLATICLPLITCACMVPRKLLKACTLSLLLLFMPANMEILQYCRWIDLALSNLYTETNNGISAVKKKIAAIAQVTSKVT